MPQSTAVNPIVQLLPLALIFAIFYFLIIRPQKQKEKEHQKMLLALNKNDEVVTLAGIHGTIVNLKEKTLTLRVDENVKIEIDRSSVAYVKKSS
jgi:preprotein translocase subunit YajC